ncbi:hypothetical protein COU17_00555 [Candidatus Kaiserbacteria bacterium CG10_big_fil_rev_8_21_14_0_10_49_17]|uniref:Uncharacterized protein n=1 Tax=Candidatus Kaiserbacteria bacterium CG10_big_fil_rev_8_21_14_0_10_49_17 TaxID=1974609 RepID=A0A2M6WFB9_9BACT|nr:MAG: hypothetical protein COU17_00555 [Candidatus Kaiserbacteria bacterium CG10_big_fil_rev_8_21_14_0_10_49_17]
MLQVIDFRSKSGLFDSVELIFLFVCYESQKDEVPAGFLVARKDQGPHHNDWEVLWCSDFEMARYAFNAHTFHGLDLDRSVWPQLVKEACGKLGTAEPIFMPQSGHEHIFSAILEFDEGKVFPGIDVRSHPLAGQRV